MIREILTKLYTIAGEPIINRSQIDLLKKQSLSEAEKIVVDSLEQQLRGHSGTAKECLIKLHSLRRAAEKEDWKSIEAYVVAIISKIHNIAGDYKAGLSFIEESVRLFEKHDPDGYLLAYYFLGYSYMINRMYEEGEKEFLRCLSLGSKHQDKKITAFSLFGLGELNLRQGFYLDAKESLVKAITYFKEIGIDIYLFSPLNDYGLILKNFGELPEAISVFEELIELANNPEMFTEQGLAYSNLSLCYRSTGDFDLAEQCSLKALELLGKTANKQTIKKIYNNLGLIYGKLEKNDLAIESFQKAYEISCELNDEFQQRLVRNNILYYKLMNGQFSEGMKQEIEENANYLKKNNLDEMYIKAQNLLAYYYMNKKEYEKACDVLDDLITQQRQYYKKQLQVQNQDFYDTFNESILRRERIKGLLEQNLQKSIKHQLIGNSKKLRYAVDMAKKASKINNINVLITGESGTGKEILSRLIHFNSERKDQRLVTVNCSAITSSLAESEFFGHVEGAFTGAVYNKAGFFEQANGGTLYLDEIGDMPVEIQSKLLRVIESGKLTPVGSDKSIKVDVRIVASTNKDLNELILQNQFRLDLLHRINAIHITIPPLRERMEDLDRLIEHFVFEMSKVLNKRNVGIDESYIAALRQYKFPGNIRELKNIVERSMILENSNNLTAQSLPDLQEAERKQDATDFGTFNLEDVERRTIFAALESTNQSQKNAAKLLGLTESTLCRKLKKFKQS